MISSIQEVDESIALIDQAYNELIEEKHSIKKPEIGVMIEVPSAVYLAKEISKKVDFLSVGTNDLIQYLLAVDRNNSRISSLYQSLHPAVIRSLLQVVNDAHVSQCFSMFLEHRKLRGSVNVCFQDANSLMDNDIGHIILEQCPTKFIFPNPSANKEHFKALNLNEYEWAYVTGNLPISRSLKRSVLVKKNNESVILDIDMSGMGNLLKLYKSGSDSVKLRQQY